MTLALFGGRETSFGSPADIEQGQQTTVQGPNGILGLDGFAPPLRVVMVVPDGVAKISFLLPRQAYPGAIAYPASQTITVPVHNNIAAFQTDRYIDEDRWSKIGMIPEIVRQARTAVAEHHRQARSLRHRPQHRADGRSFLHRLGRHLRHDMPWGPMTDAVRVPCRMGILEVVRNALIWRVMH